MIYSVLFQGIQKFMIIEAKNNKEARNKFNRNISIRKEVPQ